jgi:hypothetical protein
MSDPAYPAVTTMMMQAADGCQACFEACAGWQQEMARFVDLRLAENRRTWEALMASRDLMNALKVQQEWGLQAATDYTQEATRLARLVTSLSLTGTTPAVQEAASLVA